jgi:hypothetical protein
VEPRARGQLEHAHDREREDLRKRTRVSSGLQKQSWHRDEQSRDAHRAAVPHGDTAAGEHDRRRRPKRRLRSQGKGFPTPSVQWELSISGGGTWAPVKNATSSQLTIASAKTSEDGHEYRALIGNAAGGVISEAPKPTVHNVPKLTQQPAGVIVVQVSQNGNRYRVAFTNAAGTTFSEVAKLTVAIHHYRVVGWGANSTGQLGDGSFTQSDTPVLASGLNFVSAVAAGKSHSLALLNDGASTPGGRIPPASWAMAKKPAVTSLCTSSA